MALNSLLPDIKTHIEQLFTLGFDHTGACTALTYSERLAHRSMYVAQLMHQLGMAVHHDAVGNLIGVFAGKRHDKRIMITSHLDTVINAGRYDGVLGIVLGITLIQHYKQSGYTPEYDIEIRVCMGEESPGLTATFGSKAVTGEYSTKTLEHMPLKWDQNTLVPQALQTYFATCQRLGNSAHYTLPADLNLNIPTLAESQVDPAHYLCAFEVHAEQHSTLKDQLDRPTDAPFIGVMTGIGGHLRSTFTLHDAPRHSLTENKATAHTTEKRFSGPGGHSGATPMMVRDDALVTACDWLLSKETAILQGDITIQDISIHAPSSTSIPAEVTITFSDSSATPGISANLLLGIAMMVLCSAKLAAQFPNDSAIRATISQLSLGNGVAELYCDSRGMNGAHMAWLHQQQSALPLPGNVHSSSAIHSTKEPVWFQADFVQDIAGALLTHFDGRVLTGAPSIPGQDVGNFARVGIPSVLLFTESSSGHHPGEYVRDAAILQGLDALDQCVRLSSIKLEKET